MRLKQIITAAVLILILSAGSGCKKTETEKKNFAITGLTDVAGNPVMQFTYTPTGKILQIYSPSDSYDFLYSGDKLVTRSYTQAGIYIVDSFFYDISGRVYRVVEYDLLANVKVKTTVLIYNGDNTINSASVDYASAFTDDEIYELTYAGGKYSGWIRLVNKSGSYYQPDYKTEFLAYDDKPNPLAKIYQEGLMDVIDMIPYFAASPNSFTSAKQTDYDSVTGLEKSIRGLSAVYQYNADGLPVSFDFMIGNLLGIYLIQYKQL